jgi:hypothetical protein
MIPAEIESFFMVSRRLSDDIPITGAATCEFELRGRFKIQMFASSVTTFGWLEICWEDLLLFLVDIISDHLIRIVSDQVSGL